ncbi:MAG: ion channel [Gaiellaceae bacterium]
MLSALFMFRRFVRVVRHALREEDFLPVVSAGVFLVLVGTTAYTLGEGWNVVDALYFAVATLTTTNVADPELVLEHRRMKVFTVLYLLVGIGILVEILRRLGMAFVAVRTETPRGRQRGSTAEVEPDGSASE